MDVNGRGCQRQTPLFCAALYPDVPMIRILLDAGADPSVRDDSGKTALDIVTALPPIGDGEREETIKLLSSPVPH
jgi:ankyrin repeat protein